MEDLIIISTLFLFYAVLCVIETKMKNNKKKPPG